METHSSVLALRIPGTGEPGGLPCMGSHRVGHDWSDLAAAAAGHCSHALVAWKWKLLSCVWLFATPWTLHGILQARILEWVAFPFSRGSSQPRDRTQVSRIAGGFFNQRSHKGSPRILEWVAYPFSSGSSWSRDWDPGIERGPPVLQGDSLPTELSGKPFSHNTWECERTPFGCLAGQFFLHC